MAAALAAAEGHWNSDLGSILRAQLASLPRKMGPNTAGGEAYENEIELLKADENPRV